MRLRGEGEGEGEGEREGEGRRKNIKKRIRGDQEQNKREMRR